MPDRPGSRLLASDFRPSAMSRANFSLPNNPLSLDPVPTAVPSSIASPVSGGTIDALPAERKLATFSVEEMTEYLAGGKEKLARRRFLLKPLDYLEKTVDGESKFELARDEQITQHLKHFHRIHDAYYESFKPTREDLSIMYSVAVFKGDLSNHFNLFLPTLQGQASEEQCKVWLPLARTLGLIGCYAQTELGHGSNVRGLQTTATFDKQRQEFILETPTLLALKWWPGALGKVATHALVYAQLILDGQPRGIQMFLTQIRDQHHRPLPGVEVGDLGPKLGDHANDTGFLRLTHVRVPHFAMLARYSQVTPDGQLVTSDAIKLNPKLHYTTMLLTRAQMVDRAAQALAKAATIAVRYSAVRRQGYENTAATDYRAPERLLLDHGIQRFRLLRQVAQAYVMRHAAMWMFRAVSSLEGSTLGDVRAVGNLQEIVAMSAGLKALCTYWTDRGIEDLRKCCGGNGYLLSSGIASLAADYVWQTTAEGDWVVLVLVSARFLLKSLAAVPSGKVPEPCTYLAKAFPPPSRPPTAAELRQPAVLLELLERAAKTALVDLSAELERQTTKVGPDAAWNGCALQTFDAVQLHSLAFLLRTYQQASQPAAAGLQPALTQLGQLFALSNLFDLQGLGVDKNTVFAALSQTLQQLRPNAVSLVDAFDFPDSVLNSTIGCYDGNIYENLYESAKRSSLNQSDPISSHAFLRPLLNQEFLARGNASPASKL